MQTRTQQNTGDFEILLVDHIKLTGIQLCIQDDNVAYQMAAIQALEKLHNEKLDAVAYVSEMEIKENILQQETNLAKLQMEDLHREIDVNFYICW